MDVVTWFFQQQVGVFTYMTAWLAKLTLLVRRMVGAKQAQNLQIPLCWPWTSQRTVPFISIWHVCTRIKSIDGQRHATIVPLKDKQQVSTEARVGPRETTGRRLCHMSTFSWVSGEISALYVCVLKTHGIQCMVGFCSLLVVIYTCIDWTPPRVVWWK